MIRSLLLAALVAAPALAQEEPLRARQDGTIGDPTPMVTVYAADEGLFETDRQFRDDLRAITNVVATAALVHDATGAYPTTTFGLLGSRPADRTRLRGMPLSDFTVSRDGDGVVVRYVPLPVDPYVREDRVVRVTVTQDADGLYKGDYEILRQADPDEGGERLPYDVAGRYRVTRGYGTACVDVATVQQQLAAGSYAPEPGTLGPEPLTTRVHPVGDDEPVYYENPAR
ncbi:hypothetical protein [Rubrivirga marina]|uniref:Uncharacterized protein n=1 Tax=Rubrivirga marina TaxID=1196024 RepID=A0A271J3F6_9BACT|nr:hypothetical protein [Rubrivirga marina]PAP77808.1 hypothetical protein BSZ37_15825 [Rubrivirga marina]